jgi:hypothetical protein
MAAEIVAVPSHFPLPAGSCGWRIDRGKIHDFGSETSNHRMDRRALLRLKLETSERQFAKGLALIARQELIVEQLERYGHDSRAARTLLSQLQHTQAYFLAECDGLRREIAS